MKRIVFALATVASLTATPAFAGLVDELAQEKNEAVQVVTTAKRERPFLGQYQVYGSRVAEGHVQAGWSPDGATGFVPYPHAEEPQDRGR